MEMYKSRTSKWVVKNDTTNGFRTKPTKKNNSPSPSSYQVMKSFDSSQYSKINKFHTLNKEKK
jgi:hypothetical protein